MKRAASKTAEIRGYFREHYLGRNHDLKEAMNDIIPRFGINKPTWYRLRAEFAQAIGHLPAAGVEAEPQSNQTEFVVNLPPDLPEAARAGVNQMIAHIHALEQDIATIQSERVQLVAQCAVGERRVRILKKTVSEVLEAV
jgi:hypothetical protein